MTTFAIATRDELWSHGRLLERRLSHGIAVARADGIDARDDRDETLLRRCDESMTRLRESAPRDARVRLFASCAIAGSTEVCREVIVVARHCSSIVTSPPFVDADMRLLRERGTHPAPTDLPVVWRHGSAAVLLHEAAGHAAEHRHPPLQWPAWLSVRDEPDTADDTGVHAPAADLLRGEAPGSLRRETFRDVPLPRMSRLVARQSSAPFALPSRRIEIHLLDGGSYDPLTGIVTLHVASADLIQGDAVNALAPFEIRKSREEIARAIAGARGEPVRYPGVICSSEGQELFVGSWAPDLVTVFS